MLQNAYLISDIGVDTAEHEPFKVLVEFCTVSGAVGIFENDP